jgi:hypothetical protein
MTMRAPALEHGTSRSGRWLRANRLRFALWIAVIEGLLVLVHAIPLILALLIAAAVILFYLFLGRSLPSDTGRQLSWISAASQALVALVPLLAFVVGVFAIIVVGILAAVALFVLFSDRR